MTRRVSNVGICVEYTLETPLRKLSTLGIAVEYTLDPPIRHLSTLGVVVEYSVETPERTVSTTGIEIEFIYGLAPGGGPGAGVKRVGFRPNTPPKDATAQNPTFTAYTPPPAFIAGVSASPTAVGSAVQQQFSRGGITSRIGENMEWSVKILDRTFVNILAPNLYYQPQRYNLKALFGPDSATVKVTGNKNSLYELLEFLRCPISLYNNKLDEVWWGYIDTITLELGGLTIGLSLDKMYNKIAVAYEDVSGANTGERATTAYSTDADSVAIYGTKEHLASLHDGGVDQATALRDRLLDHHKLPQILIRTGGGTNFGATLLCSGWHKTLDWRYFAKTTGNVTTSAQIATVLADVGEFVTAADIQVGSDSGITTDQFRDGDTTALQVISTLLESGKSTGVRYLAEVDHNRRLFVYVEPSSSQLTDYYIDETGGLFDVFGRAIDTTKTAVANWCRIRDVLPAYLNTERTIALSPFFIEESQIDAVTKRVTLLPRSANAWEDEFGAI